MVSERRITSEETSIPSAWNFIKAAEETSILVGIYYWQLNLHFWQLTTAIVVDEHAFLLVKPHTTGISNLQSYIVIVVIYTIIFIHYLYTINSYY